MATKIEKKWNLYNYRNKQLLLWGLRNHFIIPYQTSLIEKLRTIYHGGIPASILLLSRGMSNGHCFDRALLLSRAFLDSDEDIELVCASIKGLRLNPEYSDREDSSFADHWFVERTIGEDQHVIYDTSTGFIYDKEMYWMMESPRVKRSLNKDTIKRIIESEDYHHPENFEQDKYSAVLVLPMIEMTYGRPTEIYARIGKESFGQGLLQREIEHFKKVINFDALCKEVDEDMKRLGLK